MIGIIKMIGMLEMIGMLFSRYSFDALLLAKYKPVPVPTSIVHAPAPTQQFGVELEL